MDGYSKADLINVMYGKTSVNRKDVKALVDLFIEELKASIVSQGTVELRGFGTFQTRVRKGRQNARNPRTGEPISVEPHRIVVFKPGRNLKQKVWPL
ncbi:MAG: integration host factor subunit beta [Treponema sp.]|nr:integration host factor subunit beta [Treponema sp.]